MENLNIPNEQHTEQKNNRKQQPEITKNKQDTIDTQITPAKQNQTMRMNNCEQHNTYHEKTHTNKSSQKQHNSRNETHTHTRTHTHIYIYIYIYIKTKL